LDNWSRSFPEQTTARRELSGYVCLRTAPSPLDSDEGDVAKEERLDALWKHTATVVRDLARQSPRLTIGILTRRNATVGRLIYELGKLEVEASEEGGNPLTDSAAVQLVLSLLTLADHPGHTAAGFHVASSPLGRVLGYTSHRDERQAHQFSARLRERLVEQGYGGFVQELVPQLQESCNARELRRLVQLAAMGDEFDALGPTLRPGDFVSYVDRQRREEPTNARVRVMNIHQAKGLEFDIVVLPELDQQFYRPPRYVTRSPFPGSPPDLVALYRNEHCLELAGGLLQEARRQTLGRSMQEALCLLYVAMTRAIHSLQMIILPETNAKARLPKTHAGLVRAALAPDRPAAPETVLFQHGDPHWFEKIAFPEADQADQPSVCEPKRIALKFAPSTARRRLDRATPSGQKTSRHRSWNEVWGTRPAEARMRGTLVHRWLERLDWLEDGPPVDRQLRDVRPGEFSVTADIEAAETLLLSAMAQPAIKQLFLRESYADWIAAVASRVCGDRVESLSDSFDLSVRHELPFAYLFDEKLMVGNIDRLVLATRNGEPVAADVLDFKTDVLSSADALRERIELYRGQMTAYREAVSRLFELEVERITVRLAFLSIGQVETLEFSNDLKAGAAR
jgi:ATP-dependent exoDNAse (exonuclease V) beta subunit